MTPLLQALYLFFPVLVAAVLSAFVLKFDLWHPLRRPIDGGRSWRGRRLFGDSKTWRGVVVAVVGCTLGVAIQRGLVGSQIGSLALVDYARTDAALLGVAMGAGAMLGELPNSFTKRWLGIAPGKTTKGPRSILFYLWDQLDLLVGAWPAISYWVELDARVVVASFAIAIVAHPAISLVGFLLGARKTAR